jgi:hypothetical protein
VATNNNDLQIVSDSILEGHNNFDDLPPVVQQRLAEYWQGAAPKDASQQPDLEALAKERSDRMAKLGGTPTILKPIEALGSGLYWLYSQTISPAVSTLGLFAHRAVYGKEIEDQISVVQPGYEWDTWGEMDAKDMWSDAHYVSPAQAIWMLGFNNKELRERGISPNQMAEDKKAMARGEYDFKKQGKPKWQEYFQSGGASQLVTGAGDFALSWYADPLVLGLKTGGAAVKGLKTQPITEQIEKAGAISGKPEEAFNLMSQTPTYQKMVDTVMDIKLNNPDNAALILRRDFKTFDQSANGDVAARLLEQAKDADEVSDVLRIMMGDNGGYVSLQMKNVVLETQLKALSARTIQHNTYLAGLSPAKQASPYGQRVKAAIGQQEKAIANMEGERGIISDKLNAFKSLDNMNFNQVTTPAAIKARQSDIVTGEVKALPMGVGVKGMVNTVANIGGILPIKIVRSYNDIKPSYFLDVHAENSYKELDAALREHKSMPRDIRERFVSDYIKATPNQRSQVLQKMENEIVRKMVDDFNAKGGTQIDRDIADHLYTDFLERRRGTQAAAGSRTESYGGGRMEDPNNPGLTVRIAEIDSGGGRIVPTPMFDTQLANNHILMDFKTMERAIATQGERFQKLKDLNGKLWYKTDETADYLGTIWKFAQLARLGYGPRALADDFLGQLARFGGMAMAARVGEGSATFVTDLVRGKFMKNSVSTARANMQIQDKLLGDLTRMQTSARNELLRVRAGMKQGDAKAIEDAMNDVTDEITKLKLMRAEQSDKAALGSQMRDVKIGRQVFEGPLAGKQGEMFRDFTAGQRNFANLMGSSSDWYLKRMRRQNWQDVSVGKVGEEKHLEAWYRVVNDQIGQSELGRLVLLGANETDVVKWLQSPAGKKFKDVMPVKHLSDIERARNVIKYVDDILPLAGSGMDAARVAAAEGKLTPDMLKTLPARNRPDVQMEMYSYAEGRNPVTQLLDSSIEGWYKFSNQLPATHLLRHPLFGQQYKANLADAVKRLEAQGVTRIDETMRKTLESNARQAALKDVKSFTFTMDHETKMAYGMKHMGAFFGAQQESWNRWARIISDKPQVLGRIGQFYLAPSRAGLVVDNEGNPVDASGHIVDPITGEKKLTKFGERKVMIQIPEYLGGKKLNSVLGLDEDASLTIPMSSLNIVLNHGDGYLPVGAGPFIQMATNHFAQDNPNLADVAKKFGVLPFGPQDSVMDFINPTTGKRMGDSMDDHSETKQRSLFYSMQVEHYKYETGLRDTEPTWEELEDRADRWSWFRTAMAFSLPFSMNQQDPYQYFRDEFDRMQKLDPDSADEKFYEKYGDSFYMFSRSMSKNNTGVKPTVEGVQMSAYYQDLINKVGPEYAALIVGDEGDGEFSQGAYFYQKTHGAGAGSGKMQREQLDPREAWEKGETAKGWQQFNSAMTGMDAQLFKAGFSSYDDPGAEQLKLGKKAILFLLTQETMPSGQKNKFYNESWAKEWNSFDKGKYDRNASKLHEIAEDPELWAKAVNEDGSVGIRSDIYTLRSYLDFRKEMKKALLIRKQAGGSDDITTQQNADLKDSWDRTVLKLLEADTKFGWVHRRYFATDMGFDLEAEQAAVGREDKATQQPGAPMKTLMEVQSANPTGYPTA